MAEVKDNTTKKVETKKEDNLVPLYIERLPGQKKDQTVYISVNFKNYLIKRGESVMVPKEVKETWDNHLAAMNRAYDYAEENGVREP